MNERLLEIINYKTGGSRKEFAELMGWSQPYMTKLLKNDFGIKPVISILEKLPEINSRWFLLGTGNMLDDARLTDIRKATHEYISKILDLEKYMPVMSAGELKEYEQVASYLSVTKFCNHVKKYHDNPDREHRNWTTYQVATHYLDYLSMCIQMEYDMTDTIKLFPHELYAAHEKMVL